MSDYDEWVKDTGDENLFFEQLNTALQFGLPINGPVYRNWSPRQKILQLLKPVLELVKVYDLVTVRQIYYRLVVQQIISNALNEYRRVVRVLKRGRLAGFIPFGKVIDDTREAEKTPSWMNIQEIMRAAIRQYRSDWWMDQPNYVEVWLEKRALRRIFYPITNAYDVHLCVGGGYQSWSEVWEAKQRFESRKDQNIIILYFGDLDPSGKDMPRDIEDRLKILKTPITVKEIALTEEDIRQYNLPRNPTKPKDSRNEWFIKKYGITYAVELDALSPDILRKKIREAIKEHVDLDKLMDKRKQDEKERGDMNRWIDYYNQGED